MQWDRVKQYLGCDGSAAPIRTKRIPNLVPLLQQWRGVGGSQDDIYHLRGRYILLSRLVQIYLEGVRGGS